MHREGTISEKAEGREWLAILLVGCLHEVIVKQFIVVTVVRYYPVAACCFDELVEVLLYTYLIVNLNHLLVFFYYCPHRGLK